jgi:hypothetical protein
MANKPLLWLPFLFTVNTSNDSGRVNPDPSGFFYARQNTVRFLDIESKVFTGFIEKEKDAYQRTLTLADGTVLAQSPENSDGQVNKSPYELRPKAKPGGKNIKILTGKQTAKKNYQSISFNFPHWATLRAIADALGELIPASKMKLEPSANDIFPYAYSPGGRKIWIVDPSVAAADNTVEVATTDSEQNALAQKLQGKRKKGAGT